MKPKSKQQWEKVQSWHREKLAVVYVRQSDPHQVKSHQESARLQYGLAVRAQELGWPEDRVVVIDDDQGKSADSAEARLGFQGLVSEVSLGHVGIILGMDCSRLARSNKDWYQLLELCALFGTLIVDLDGVYDPGQYNDRLLLGLKGTISEAELHIIKQRMQQGRLSKARRGELALPLPTGYIRRASGEVVLDPDEQVQHVVRLVFRKFEELGTINAVMRYLSAHDIQLGIRVHEGIAKGELEWRRPSRMTLQNMLKNPIYAGAYAYGRRQVDPRRKAAGRPRTGRVVMGADDWHVLLKDQMPAYITWEQYERNVAKLKANRARWDEVGAVRHGPALLSGLLMCAKCGRRMRVSYGGRRNLHTYLCSQMVIDYGGEVCQSIAGPALDEFVTSQVLSALEPAALELSLEAAGRLQGERDDLERLWQQRLERARYEAERAGRQYRLVEPENRLVARQLERDWEEKLATQQHLEEDYHRFIRAQPRMLTAAEREAVRRLAQDIPALWRAPTTTTADRKEIIRQIVERIAVDAEGVSERVRVAVEWVGGTRTEGVLIRPVRCLEQLSYYEQMCERVRVLAGEGLTSQGIAERLSAEGYHTTKRREGFGRRGVQDLMHRLGLCERRSCSEHRDGLGEDEWWLPELARKLEMPISTLSNWVRRGWVRAHHEEQPRRRRVIWADDAELERLRELRQRPRGYYTRRLWIGEPVETSNR